MQRRRHKLRFHRFISLGLIVTLYVTNGFGAFPENPVSTAFQQVVQEQYPAVVSTAFDGLELFVGGATGASASTSAQSAAEIASIEDASAAVADAGSQTDGSGPTNGASAVDGPTEDGTTSDSPAAAGTTNDSSDSSAAEGAANESSNSSAAEGTANESSAADTATDDSSQSGAPVGVTDPDDDEAPDAETGGTATEATVAATLPPPVTLTAAPSPPATLTQIAAARIEATETAAAAEATAIVGPQSTETTTRTPDAANTATPSTAPPTAVSQQINPSATPPTVWPTHTPTKPWPTHTPTKPWATHTPTRTPQTPTATARPTEVAPPTATPIPTSTPEPPRPTNTPEPPRSTNTPEPTNTSTPEPTNTSTPEPTNTSTPEPTNTSTPESTNTPTLVPSSTPDPAGSCAASAPPLAHWTFEEGAGSTTADIESGFAAQLENGVEWTGSTANGLGALRFDGVDGVVQVAHDASLAFDHSDSFSISLWVKTTDSDGGTLIAKQDAGNTPYPFRLELLDTGEVVFGRSDGTNTPLITSSNPINDGHYHHIVAVKHNQRLRLYVDKTLVARDRDTTTTSTVNSEPLKMGLDTTASGRQSFDGWLDDVRIYDMQLCSAAVRDIADGSVPATAKLYRFDWHGGQAQRISYAESATVLHNNAVEDATLPFDTSHDVGWFSWDNKLYRVSDAELFTYDTLSQIKDGTPSAIDSLPFDTHRDGGWFVLHGAIYRVTGNLLITYATLGDVRSDTQMTATPLPFSVSDDGGWFVLNGVIYRVVEDALISFSTAADVVSDAVVSKEPLQFSGTTGRGWLSVAP